MVNTSQTTRASTETSPKSSTASSPVHTDVSSDSRPSSSMSVPEAPLNSPVNSDSSASSSSEVHKTKAQYVEGKLPQVLRKRGRPIENLGSINASLDQIEREFEVVKVKLLCCRTKKQKMLINEEITRIMAKFEEIKASVQPKKIKLEPRPDSDEQDSSSTS
ncbi:unnamed protein product [Bursaphelenchus xylophilus]|uniref:(pine wood nematode) hypothetical protein n=1 Tax=Bursaphelenchus xylophilus TaxID=6326 RepID=A0A1I7SEH8_BURXY|nr:unnamed protein product [Bursaphelenchus xylophilus]CAG9113505.1 unnamed protein product [Bursaphelenchus xylophilus]